MKKWLCGVAGLAGCALAYSAQAGPIAAGSSLSINGDDNYTATSITFTNPANIGAENGSFAAAGLIDCTGCVTMTSFSTATLTPFQLYTATEGAITTALLVSSVVFSFDPGGPGHLPSLEVNGLGTLSLTGFDDTPGMYSITTQGPTGETRVTFSETAVATLPTLAPEPGSLALVGYGILGIWLVRRIRYL